MRAWEVRNVRGRRRASDLEVGSLMAQRGCDLPANASSHARSGHFVSRINDGRLDSRIPSRTVPFRHVCCSLGSQHAESFASLRYLHRSEARSESHVRRAIPARPPGTNGCPHVAVPAATSARSCRAVATNRAGMAVGSRSRPPRPEVKLNPMKSAASVPPPLGLIQLAPARSMESCATALAARNERIAAPVKAPSRSACRSFNPANFNILDPYTSQGRSRGFA